MNNKNPIGLHILFALLGLGISLLFLGISVQLILEMQHNEYADAANSGEVLAGGAFGLGGGLCLIFSIALILRLEWAKIAFQVILILGGIAWMTFIVIAAAESSRAWAVLIGMAAAGLMIVVFGILFLESPHLQNDLKKGAQSQAEHWDILDQ